MLQDWLSMLVQRQFKISSGCDNTDDALNDWDVSAGFA